MKRARHKPTLSHGLPMSASTRFTRGTSAKAVRQHPLPALKRSRSNRSAFQNRQLGSTSITFMERPRTRLADTGDVRHLRSHNVGDVGDVRVAETWRSTIRAYPIPASFPQSEGCSGKRGNAAEAEGQDARSQYPRCVSQKMATARPAPYGGRRRSRRRGRRERRWYGPSIAPDQLHDAARKDGTGPRGPRRPLSAGTPMKMTWGT